MVQHSGLTVRRPERTAVEVDGHDHGITGLELIAAVELQTAHAGDGHLLDDGQNRYDNGGADVALADGEGLRAGLGEAGRVGGNGILALFKGELVEARGVRGLIHDLKQLVRLKVVAHNHLQIGLHGGGLQLGSLGVSDVNNEVAGHRLAGNAVGVAYGQGVGAHRGERALGVGQPVVGCGGGAGDRLRLVLSEVVLPVIGQREGQARRIEALAHIVGADIARGLFQLIELCGNVDIHRALDGFAGCLMRVGDVNGGLAVLQRGL